MKIIERRLVIQEWYETEYTKTGWDSNRWVFRDDMEHVSEWEWTIIEHLREDKYGNPTVGVAEKETEIWN